MEITLQEYQSVVGDFDDFTPLELASLVVSYLYSELIDPLQKIQEFSGDRDAFDSWKSKASRKLEVAQLIADAETQQAGSALSLIKD